MGPSFDRRTEVNKADANQKSNCHFGSVTET